MAIRLREKSQKNHTKRQENVLLKMQYYFKSKILMKTRKAESCPNTVEKKPLANLINVTCPARSFQLTEKFT